MNPEGCFRMMIAAFLIVLLAACSPEKQETIPAMEEDLSAAESLTGGSLAELSSYRLTLEMTTRWEVDGRMVEEKETIIQEASRSPQEILHIRHVRLNEETGIIPVSSDRYRIGQLAFESEQLPDGDVCHIYDIEQSPLAEDGAIDPQTFFESVERKGPEDRGRVVNDVVADRFSASGMTLPLDVVEEEVALLWVAQKGGYIVRFTVEASGQLTVDGESVPAALSWEYNLYDANTEMEIALSPDCQQQKAFLDSLPVPDSAQEVQILDNGVSFSAPETSDVVADFIRDGMKSTGWKSVMDHEDEMEGMYLFIFQQGERYLDVMIGQPEEGGTFVTYMQR